MGLADSVAAQGQTVRDSAGVRIVQHHESRESPAPIWRVDPEPDLVIGMVDGPEAYLLMNPRAATVLQDGTVAVQDSYRGVFGIRYFDSDAAHLTTVGRWGEGPWEFHAWVRLHGLPGDSLLVIDQAGKFAVWGPRGERVREGRFNFLPLQPVFDSYLIDAGHLGVAKGHQLLGMPAPGLQNGHLLYLMYDIATGRADTLVAHVWSTAVWEESGNGVRSYPYPFAAAGHAAGGGGRLWLGQSVLPELRAYGPDASLVMILRFGDEPRTVTRQDRRQFEDRMLAGRSGDDRRRYARYGRRMEFPDVMPFFGHVAVDVLGDIWVQRYEPPWTEGDQKWDVYSPDGERLAAVSIPARALSPCARRLQQPCNRILEIGADYLLMDAGGSADVRYVVRYRIRKPE